MINKKCHDMTLTDQHDFYLEHFSNLLICYQLLSN